MPQISAPLLPLSAGNSRLFLADTVYVRDGGRFCGSASGGGQVPPFRGAFPRPRPRCDVVRHRRAAAVRRLLRSAAWREAPRAFTLQTFGHALVPNLERWDALTGEPFFQTALFPYAIPNGNLPRSPGAFGPSRV